MSISLPDYNITTSNPLSAAQAQHYPPLQHQAIPVAPSRDMSMPQAGDILVRRARNGYMVIYFDQPYAHPDWWVVEGGAEEVAKQITAIQAEAAMRRATVAEETTIKWATLLLPTQTLT